MKKKQVKDMKRRINRIQQSLDSLIVLTDMLIDVERKKGATQK